ncbi:aa3-type cytochrome c oxidase subunit IV [Aureimonas sp. AU12]|uniref:aa3-type cytochrome c oxidase subunit IV n=1 Tax=Aureimonas sp. AU12 TaxID=1638161 RepID=UPI00078128C4|nr:aa3-type cytochrome c oxidase subunit IV [Aureimonas sp. AU12]
MAEEMGFELNKGAAMDYAEHKRTYAGFLGLVKYGSIGVIAILLGMLVGLIVGGGVILSVLTMAVFAVLAVFFLR